MSTGSGDFPVAQATPTANIPGSAIYIGGDVKGDVASGPIVKECTDVAVHTYNGTVLNAASRPAIERLPERPHPPRPMRGFLDRTVQINAVRPEIQAGGGAWIHGVRGCGTSSFLRQVAKLSVDPSLVDGVAYMRGERSSPHLNDVLQCLFGYFYTSAVDVVVSPQAAQTCLSGLRALFLLDSLPLAGKDMLELTTALSSSAVLVAANDPAPDTMLDLPLGGLPQDDALALCAREALLDGVPPDNASLLSQLCIGLDCMPLPLRLIGRLLRSNRVSLAQLAAVLDEKRDRREREVGRGDQPDAPAQPRCVDSLALAVELVLAGLSEWERGALAALVRAGGPDADLTALEAIGQLPASVLEPALAKLVDLGLVMSSAGRYEMPSASLRREVDRQISPGDERQRAAAFFASAGAQHIGDLAWLGQEWLNLIAAIKTLLAQGLAAQAGTLAQAVQPILVLRGMWGSWGEVTALAEQAARVSGSLALRAWALHERGTRAGLYGDRLSAGADLAEAHRLRLDLRDQMAADTTLHNMEYLGLLPPAGGSSNAGSSGRGLGLFGRRIPLWLIVVLGFLLLGGSMAGAVTLINREPTADIRANPTTGSYGLTPFSFDASGSSDPNGGDTLTYRWDFGDGTVVSSTTSLATHIYAKPGDYTVRLTVSDSRSAQSGAQTVRITVINTNPKPVIEQPASDTQVRVEQRLAMHGSATDQEEKAPLTGAALRWTVILHTDATTRTLTTATGNTASLVVPPPDSLSVAPTSYLEIQLAATDSLGATSIVTRELRPELARLSFTTIPAGLRLNINDASVAVPQALDPWVGEALTVTALEQPDGSGGTLVFESWSDGGGASHLITATAATTSYTATFRSLAIGFGGQAFSVPENVGSAPITVTLNAPSAQTRTVAYSTLDDTAIAGKDYTTASGTLTFAPGETSKTFSVLITDNQLDQADRTLALQLRDLGGTTLPAQVSASLTITDDDPPPTVGFTAQTFSVRESAGVVAITVALDKPSGQTVTVDYATGDDTSRAGRDYTAASGTLTFAPGETSKTFDVPILDNKLDEGNGRVKLQLSNLSNTTPSRAAATLTIEDDDPPPSVTFNQAAYTVSEGDGAARITVVLSARSLRR
ncbi:MAG: Calx-beta domain-containing protein, partial [Roseiflexaceae bacterium]